MSKKILLCVTGGIAAYKIPALVRIIIKAGYELEIIMTREAEKFVSPLVLSTLAGKKIWLESDFFSNEYGHEIAHIKLSRWADLIVIAPCSANMISKIARGCADDLMSSALIASDSPVIIFPAMNENMFNNFFTQENLKLIARNKNYCIIEPSAGDLACGTSGRGRMPEPENIALEIKKAFTQKNLLNKKILVTAGPTHEYLDPVRFISNPSTGKMGIAMARAAWYRGADVKIIAGPSINFDPWGFNAVINIISAQDMLNSVMDNLSWADYIVKAAAVGDYRAEKIEHQKIKREHKENLTLNLIENPDIANEAGKLKRSDQILIGFAAETQNLIENAQNKLTRKNLDYILVNDVAAKDSGFASDTNTVRLIARADKNIQDQIFSGLKEDVASNVWDFIASN